LRVSTRNRFRKTANAYMSKLNNREVSEYHIFG
jgi:hypothetical protein